MPTLEVNYSKKLGLPNFSSHSLSVTIRTEIDDVSQVQPQTSLLYQLLQSSVDEEMKQVGFLPDARTYGRGGPESRAEMTPSAKCTVAQRAVIVGLARSRGLGKKAIHDLSMQIFGVGNRELDSNQAASFINELTKIEPDESNQPEESAPGEF